MPVYLALSGWIGLAAWSSGAKEFTWQSEVAGRSAALEVSANGKTGFTAMPPQQTGIWFTNTLEEWQGASNRVLFNGSGAAAGDYDQDGWPDLYFCSLNGRNTLYKNLGGWRFRDVTEEAGLKRDGRFYRGAVFADINGDGALDLLVCVVGAGVQCLLNDGRGRFTDTTLTARTESGLGSITLALADVDGNGSLDIYVANNRTDDIRDRGQVKLNLVNGQMQVPPSLKNRLVVVGGQVLEYGEPDVLLMNDGQGRFTPVSWTGGRFRNEAGGPLTQAPLDWGLTATFRDLNEDGAPDLYVCNDFWTPDRCWLNDGKGRFRAVSRLALRNMCASSMAVDIADINRDGHPDLMALDMLSRSPQLRKRQRQAQRPMAQPIGAIDNRPEFMRNTLQVNRGDGTFAEIANYAGVAASEWSWSLVFQDVDLDGYEDILIATGHAKDVQDMDAEAEIQARQHSWQGFRNETERQKAFTQELMEHMRLYPRLETPIIAFRNQGGLRFEEVTTAWGTEQPGIHHAMAMADFDRDGDLDMVVNNLGSAAGVYRNETIAPRVAVRLQGLPPNIQGIGAKVRLLDGAVPMQSQEVISGGRYMSGSEPLLVFAAGTTKDRMTLEVTWRSGRQSRITGVKPNRLYEISESTAPNPSPGLPQSLTSTNPPPARLFEDVSHLLQHTHHEDPFDDFDRQPLLPRRLSQLGPGVSWFDGDGDGREDLMIGSGKGGQFACYRNNGAGGFQRLSAPFLAANVTRDQTTILGWHLPGGAARLLAGSANYEDATSTGGSVQQYDLTRKATEDIVPADTASVGPLALADLEGDGDLDLFVGGRVVPGRYPEAASSRLYRCEAGQFKLDTTNSSPLQNAGLVSSAVWSDLDGDGLPELILACEWGPLRIFRNRQGRLTPWDAPINTAGKPASTLGSYTGWWQGVSTGDLDGDGRLDIVAANWGLNSEYTASLQQPMALYHGDFSDRGLVDLLEAEWDPLTKRHAPRQRMDIVARSWPTLLERFRSHLAYSKASMDEVLGSTGTRARKAEVTTLASLILFNRGDHFEIVPLPDEAQWAPAFAVNVADFDGDGSEDVFLSQNFFALPAETPRLDAGRGLLLKGDGKGKLTPMPGQHSGIEIYGEQRGAAIADFDADGRADLVVTQNGAATKLYHNRGARPGLRIRLAGPSGNPNGVGATLRLQFGSRLGPAREIHAGSGYWSQDSAIQVMSLPEAPTHLWVRWPGGRESTVVAPPNAPQLTVSFPGSAGTP